MALLYGHRREVPTTILNPPAVSVQGLRATSVEDALALARPDAGATSVASIYPRRRQPRLAIGAAPAQEREGELPVVGPPMELEPWLL